MNIFKTKTSENEYQYLDEIIKEVWVSKYLFGIRVSKNCTTTKTPIPPITEIICNSATMGKVTIKIDMRVIVRSNEPGPLMIGKVKSFTTFGRIKSDAIPIVEDELDSKEYLTMGVILPYSDSLLEELKDLKPIEQWNYLTFPHGQIKEKYGIKYKTFR